MKTNTLQNIKQLYFWNHLEINEVLEMGVFLKNMLNEVDKRKKTFIKYKIEARDANDYIEIWPFYSAKDALDECKKSWYDTNLIKQI